MPTPNPTRSRDGATGANESSQLLYLIRRQLGKVRTTTLVKVLACTNNGALAAVGTVDVQPLIQQLDGQGNVMSLPPLYGLPYVRLQGGANAIILDPQPGDIGLALFGDRDLSAAEQSKALSPPGSRRQHSMADGLYIGGVLNGVPSQYVQFEASGIVVNSPGKVTVIAPNVEVDASTQFKVVSPDIQLQGAVHITGAQTNDSTIAATGDVTGQGTSLHNHTHTSESPGTPTSPPL